MKEQMTRTLTVFFAVVIVVVGALMVMGAGIGTGHTLIDLAHLSTAQAEDSITPNDLAHGSLRFRDTSTVTIVITELADGTGALVRWNVDESGLDLTLIPVPGGDTEVIYNETGNFGSEAAFTYDDATDTLTCLGTIVGGTSITIDGTTNPGTIQESHGLLSFGDDGLITDGTYGAGAAWPWAGAGTGLVWCPRVGAFRAGGVTGTEWDVGNVGDYSFGGGYNNTLSGSGSGGWGQSNDMSGAGSGGWGQLNEMSGSASGGWGNSNTVSGNYAGAWGQLNEVSGICAGAWGDSNVVSGNSAGAIGHGNTVSGSYSLAVGDANRIDSGYNLVSGYNLWLSTEATHAYALGNGTTTLQLPEPDTFYAIVSEFIKADPDTLGAEKVDNGTFTGDAAGWTVADPPWHYNANAVDKYADGVGTLSQDCTEAADEIYLLVFTISNWSVGTCTPSVGGVGGAAVDANGTYRQLILATGAGNLTFTPSNTARFTIDYVSLKQVTGGDMHVAGNLSVEGTIRGALGSFEGALEGVTSPAIDKYINNANVAYAGTAAADSYGIVLPWAATIIGISANCTFIDMTDVATIDVYPRSDGTDIHANCKLTLPESAGMSVVSTSTTFTPGTYNVTADQVLGIYIDIIGDTPLGDSILNNLTVSVFYQTR